MTIVPLPTHLQQFVRFAIVGVTNVLISFVVFWLCYSVLKATGAASDIGKEILAPDLSNSASQESVSMAAAIATAIGYCAGVLNSYFLNRSWTFAVRERSHAQFVRFLMINLVGLSISTSLMFVLVDIHGNPYLLTWALTTGVVMLLNFVGIKYWAFAAGDVVA